MSCKTIFLIGLRGSGKTKLGEVLAEKLGYDFCDTDDHIQETYGETIAEMVTRSGWQYFRDQEKALLRNFALTNIVVATGGGVVLDEENCTYMKENGICVFLDAAWPVLVERLMENPIASQRPAFLPETLEEEVRRLHKERQHIYESVAHFTVDARSEFESLADEIQKYVDSLV